MISVLISLLIWVLILKPPNLIKFDQISPDFDQIWSSLIKLHYRLCHAYWFSTNFLAGFLLKKPGSKSIKNIDFCLRILIRINRWCPGFTRGGEIQAKIGAPWLWNTTLTTPQHRGHPAGCIREIKIRYLIRTICCRGLATSILSSWGKPKFASSWSFFSVLVGLAPVAPLPPDGFVLVRWEGGLCGGFCTTVLRRAFWQGDKVIQFSYRKFPSSGTITRCIRVHSHVRTHSHSLSALSLYIFIIFRSVHSIISHIFSGIV